MTAFIETRAFERFITLVIMVNAVTLGLETSPSVMNQWGSAILFIDQICLTFFVGELLLKLVRYRLSFFRSAWNLFDFAVVAIALFPATGGLSVLRALRVLRTLRLISVSPHLRQVIEGLLRAVPGLSSVGVIMGLIFYVGAVVATKLFSEAFPDWFGGIGRSAYTLFQVMTLESWSMGIARPVMEKFPLAWLFFVPFILIATFTMLNLFIAIIVTSIQSQNAPAEEKTPVISPVDQENLLAEIRALRQELKASRRSSPPPDLQL